MKREIKFRAWDLKLNKMWSLEELLEPVNYEQTCTLNHLLTPEEILWDFYSDKENSYPDKYTEYSQSDFVLMQYTGLKDKNDVEIYEGDILKYSDGDTANVEWIDKFSGYYVVNSNYNYIARLIEWDNNSEIIGNIYENSNLLTK